MPLLESVVGSPLHVFTAKFLGSHDRMGVIDAAWKADARAESRNRQLLVQRLFHNMQNHVATYHAAFASLHKNRT